MILGIDPGTLFMGFGLIAVRKNSITLLEMGVLQLARTKDHAERLQLIFSRLEGLIKLHKPSAAAIEAPFFGKNVQSMLKLGRAQGVAIAAAMMNGLNAAEYAPRKVKQSITGRGNATKEQVWEMLQRSILNLPEKPGSWDATDALGVALCHHYERKQEAILGKPVSTIVSRRAGKKASSWAAFAEANPERVGG